MRTMLEVYLSEINEITKLNLSSKKFYLEILEGGRSFEVAEFPVVERLTKIQEEVLTVNENSSKFVTLH